LMLVTGGAGFIGSHIAERLLEIGHDVRILDNFSTGRRENIAAFADRVDLREDDLRDLDAVAAASDGVEVVFHQAALASVPRSVDDPVTSNDVNVRGTLHVLVASRDAGVRRVVYASSSSVYCDTPTLPKREDMPTSPASPYAVGKLAGEHYARTFAAIYGLETLCLRYFNVFGPRQDPNSQYAAVVPIFTSTLLAGGTPTIYGDGEQSRDFTYIANVVDANLKAAFEGEADGRPLNIACGATITVNELFARLRTLTGATCTAIHDAPRPGDVKHSFADIARARDLLGFEPGVSFEDGLRLTVEWYSRESRSKEAGAG
jgi:nucleoside-diphosphate-sugar epimerase